MNNSCSPCRTTPVNSAAAELLPSQIENFVLAFFGSVTKTEVNGVVQWSLPCNLDTGLENNPRLQDEGLACYFLRLFSEGILGATGPEGPAGANGTNGYNAFTGTTQPFTQPSLDNPLVQVITAYCPAILEGSYVFIQGSGWYLVNSTDITGVLQLTLTKAVTGASGTIAAGRLVVPSGYPGESISGPTGPQGPQGDQGDPGESFTATNGQFAVASGNDYALQATSTPISFTTSSPQLLLPTLGSYLITAVVSLEGETGVQLNDVTTLRLRNTSIAGEVAGSVQSVSNIVDGQKLQVVINVIYDTDANSQTVALYGDCTTSNMVSVIATRTVLTYVRLA